MYLRIESDQNISELNIKFNSNGVVSSVITPVSSTPGSSPNEFNNHIEKRDPRDDILNRQASVTGNSVKSDDVIMPVIPDISERPTAVDDSFSNLNI